MLATMHVRNGGYIHKPARTNIKLRVHWLVNLCSNPVLLMQPVLAWLGEVGHFPPSGKSIALWQPSWAVMGCIHTSWIAASWSGVT